MLHVASLVWLPLLGTVCSCMVWSVAAFGRSDGAYPTTYGAGVPAAGGCAWQLRGAVRAHDPAAAYVQGNCVEGRRLVMTWHGRKTTWQVFVPGAIGSRRGHASGGICRLRLAPAWGAFLLPLHSASGELE